MVSEYVTLTDSRPVHSSVKFGNNGVLGASKLGNLHTDTVILTNVLQVPGLTRNLIAEGKLDDKGCTIYTKNGVKTVYDVNGNLCFQATKHNCLYVWEPKIHQSFLDGIVAPSYGPP